MRTYVPMEIKRRMRIRFAWIVAVLALVAIGFLLACSTKYSASSNGLVIVPTQGTTEGVQATAVMETFSLDLANGQMSQINNVNGPPAPGLTGSVVLDPAGAHAYVIVTQTSEFPSQTGVAVFSVGSDGKLGTATTTTLNNTSIIVGGQTESVPVAPVALAMDSAGKFLFVADSATSDASSNAVPGSISVLAIGSSGSLTEVSGSPFPLPAETGGSTPSASALAVTPTVYPVQYSFCSGHTPPTTEYLYVTDAVNYVVLNYMVDPSAGTLSLMEYAPSVPGAPTGSVPSGVAVDPCNRFVYVANAGPGSSQNNVSAYTICSTINVISTPSCPAADFSLHPVTGSPYPAGDNPGPLSVDAYGNFLYVVNTGSGNVSGFRINAATGALAAFIGQPAAAGVGANSIAVRGDDSWVFVANKTSGTLSQYAITQSDGALNPVGPVSTLDLPSGVAVK
jgi:6-phosphogluconolactonase (cycloisomerase 2 family)